MAMTKEKLKRNPKTMRNIGILSMELERMLSSDYGYCSDTILDYSTGVPRAQGITGFDCRRYRSKQDRLQRLMEESNEVKDWIESITDDTIRHVFYQKHIEGKSWKKIAKVIGMSGKEDYVRLHIHDDYLRKCGMK